MRKVLICAEDYFFNRKGAEKTLMTRAHLDDLPFIVNAGLLAEAEYWSSRNARP